MELFGRVYLVAIGRYVYYFWLVFGVGWSIFWYGVACIPVLVGILVFMVWFGAIFGGILV